MAHSIHYMGNKNLRRAGVSLPVSKHQMQEIIRCKKDFYYFFENYVKIIDLDKGLISFIPRDYQKRFVQSIHENRFTISMQPRQMGKSIAVSAYIAWFSLFHTEKRSAILANKEDMAKNILGDVKKMIENLPIWLQQGIIEWNKKSIEFENGSSVFCQGTTENSLRGDSVNLVLLDEFAHIPATTADAFFASVYPTISSAETTKIIIVSTPKGLNQFYKLWNDAINGENSYNPVLVEWHEHPNRDEAWAEKTLADIGPHRFAQEYNNDFMGSAGTLIDPVKINQLTAKQPIHQSEGLDVYEKPIEGHEYIVTVDVAHGKGLDYTVCSVFDTTSIPYKYVAKFRSNTISPLALPEMVANLGISYNRAYVLIEVNDIGHSIAESLYHELEYENIFSVKSSGRSGQILSYNMSSKNSKGLKTTKSSKKIGCANLKALIENDKLVIHDFDAIKEFSTFTFTDNASGGTYQADEGEYDDVVMSLVLFGWLVNDKIFSEMSDKSIRRDILDNDMDLIEESLLPVGFFNTPNAYGSNEPEVVQEGGLNWWK